MFYQSTNESNCNCSIDNTSTNLVITCTDFSSDHENILPNVSAKNVKVVSGLTKWPRIPDNFINTTRLDFSFNKIDLIGDLSNCPNLIVLNCSHNRLINIPKSLSQVRFLKTLDLNHNLIEVLDMELFMSVTINATTHFYLSNIRYLYIAGNKIKIINNMDLFIFGMPFLVQVDLGFNQIEQINLRSLSQFSENINKIITENYDPSIIVNDIYSLGNKSQSYWFYIRNNRIENVDFGLMGLYITLKKINEQISVDYLYLRFESIYLAANQIKCSCALFEDFNFLLNGPLNQSKYFKNLSKSPLAYTECKTSNNESINLISDLTTGKSKRSKFCVMNNAVAHLLSLNLYFNFFIELCIFIFYF
jgi:Leucine-rich repeat (LRR) protein